MEKRGRPVVLDEHMRRLVVALVAVGCSQREAARHAGCAASTITNAARRDPAFGQRLLLAHKQQLMSRLAQFNKLSRRSWRASRWLLERLWPQTYGRRQRNNVPVEAVRSLLEDMADLVGTEVRDPDLQDRLLAGLADLAEDSPGTEAIIDTFYPGPLPEDVGGGPPRETRGAGGD
jgi:hypothetical protein